MGPRWKGKEAETTAVANPMSKIFSLLQSSLVQSNSKALLVGFSLLLQVDLAQAKLLNRACFGLPRTTEKDKQWFELSMEEALYLCYILNCIKVTKSNTEMNGADLWSYASSKKENFPNLFKAYSHLRMKNWVVRPGSQYGVDFVAYRHHPSLVHSEYAVLVLAGDDEEGTNDRLRVWSDFHCTLRVCGGVAKTLLVLSIEKHGKNIPTSPSWLESCNVKERTITMWFPEQAREDQTTPKRKSDAKSTWE